MDTKSKVDMIIKRVKESKAIPKTLKQRLLKNINKKYFMNNFYEFDENFCIKEVYLSSIIGYSFEWFNSDNFRYWENKFNKIKHTSLDYYI